MNQSIEINVGGVEYKIDVLTSISTRVFVSNYIITYNKETNELRVFNANNIDDSEQEITKGELFNTEK